MSRGPLSEPSVKPVLSLAPMDLFCSRSGDKIPVFPLPPHLCGPTTSPAGHWGTQWLPMPPAYPVGWTAP